MLVPIDARKPMNISTYKNVPLHDNGKKIQLPQRPKLSIYSEDAQERSDFNEQ